MKSILTHNTPCLAQVRNLLKYRALLTLITIAVATSSAFAQSVTMRSQPIRFTIPKGVAVTSNVSLTITTAALPTPLVNLAVTGIPGSGNAAASLSQTLINSNGTTTVTLTLTNDASITPGVYDLAIEATGDASFRLPVPVEVVAVWNGAASTAFGAGGNWIGGAPPAATDKVVFRDSGGQAATTPTNIIVSADTEVASIRFAPEAAATRFHNMEILSGATLKTSGAGLAFSLHRDTKLAGQQITTTISGAGTLMVTNANAEIGILVDGQQNATLDLRNLNNFVADVSRIGLGNHRIWPNYYTNGYVGSGGANLANPPTRFVPLLFLAKTNVIKCSWVDPNNYTDGGIRDYALEIGNDEASGTTANITFRLGDSNALFLDSICYSHSGKGGGGNSFIFERLNSYALFRGIGGGANRMSVWAQGDGSGVGPSGSNVRGTVVNFANGQVDAMVDRLELGIMRTNTTGMTIQGTLSIGGAYPGSVFDVNTAILGYQHFINLGTGAGAVSGPVGTLNVASNAVVKVNNVLHLGYTVAPSIGLPSYPENCSGILNISASGTVMASNILAGGVTKLSVQNNIFINRGNLIVTNAIGTADGRINILVATNGSIITLRGVVVGETNVFVKTLSMPNVGGASSINIPSISGYTSGQVTVPLIAYVTASPNIGGLTVTPPPGLFVKSIVDNSANSTIDVTFTDVAPQVLVWRGNIDNNWDETTKNWITQVGGLQTNFVNGDSVVFDDTKTGSSTINISSSVTPGQTAAASGVVVSNSTFNYTFAGGSVLGGATTRKVGTGSLTVDNAYSPGITVVQGTLAGIGSIGATTLEAGTTMTGFSGTISGGLAASNATVSVTGIVGGGLNLIAGSLSNGGTISGPVTLATNVTLNNTVGGIMNVILPWTVPTNSTLINNGSIKHSGTVGGNQGLTLNGSLRGTGTISQHGTNTSADVRVTFGAGSSVMIGNTANEIANMTIAVRLDLLATSVTTFDVDNSLNVNDKINLNGPSFTVGKVNFGAGNSSGGTIVINKTAGPNFDLLTTLNLFDLTANTPDNANQAIPAVVPAPASGLVWDVSRTISNLTVAVMGPPFMTNQFTSTNITFTWPESSRGWRLERQTNSLAVGLAPSNGSNWVTVATSLGGTNATFLDINNGSVFFRSVQPLDSTNGTVFFRLNYP